MGNINEVIATSWADLTDRLYLNSWHESIGRFRSSFAFRGVDVANRNTGVDNRELVSSLIRNGSVDLEHHMIRNFRKYAYSLVNERDSMWNWLTLAQHHGLPTRLLDWSHSPLVALHFATSKDAYIDTDGAVWMVNIYKAHKHLPVLLSSAINEEGSFVFTTEMLEELIPVAKHTANSIPDGTSGKNFSSLKTKEYLDFFDNMNSKRTFLLFFEPPSIDNRVVNQCALFSVLSDPNMSVDEWLSYTDSEAYKVIIPKNLKREVRDKLDQANITERVLFPGLDGICTWLGRHYHKY